MIKIHYICPVCDSSTNEKVSGSVMDEPKTMKEAEKRFPKNICNYCGNERKIGNWIDSSGGSFMCNGPRKNFDKLKPEYQKEYIPQ